MSRIVARESEVEPIANEPEEEQEEKRDEARPEKAAEKRAGGRAERPGKMEEKRPTVQAVSTFFRDLVEEVKKVAWPSWPDTRRASVAVLRIVLLSLVILLAADLVSTIFFRLLFPK